MFFSTKAYKRLFCQTIFGIKLSSQKAILAFFDSFLGFFVGIYSHYEPKKRVRKEGFFL